MEFGIGMFGDLAYNQVNQQFQPPSQKFKEIIEQVKLADELKIDLLTMGEHHRPDYAVSTPTIILSALATITKHIKLASGVTVLSSADPVRVYQEFSTLDLISEKRAEIIAGRGSFIESFPVYGYDLKDYHELFEEKLNLLVQLLQNQEITWEGKFRAPLTNQMIYPQPERQIPLWVAVGGTPESVVRAAKLGLPVIFAIIGGMPAQFKPLIDFYKQQFIAFGHDPSALQVGIHSHTFIAESSDKIVNDYYPIYADQMNRIGQSRGWSPYTQMQFKGGMSPEGALFMGEPNAVIDKILHAIEIFGLTRFVAHIDVGAPTHKDMMKSIELYGDKVIPAIKKELNK